MSKSVKKILGIVLLLLGILVIMLCLSIIPMATDFSIENMIGIFIVGLFFGLPGCIMLYFSYRLLKNTIVLKTKEEREALRIKRKEKTQQIKEEKEALRIKRKEKAQQIREERKALKIKRMEKKAQKAKKKLETQQKKGRKKYYIVKHVEGLKLPKGVSCSVSLFNDDLRIWSTLKVYILPIEKLRGIDYESDVDIQKYTKSSTTKGIIGAAIFGVTGAIIGSAPKTHTLMKINDTVIIHYLSAKGIKYIVLGDSDSDARNIDSDAYGIYTMLQPLIPIQEPEQIDL